VHFAAEVHIRRLSQKPQRDFPLPFQHNGGILLGKAKPRTWVSSVRKVGVPQRKDLGSP
jgi:hypothetical protein